MIKAFHKELDFITNSINKLDDIYFLFKKWASLSDDELARIPEARQINENIKANNHFYNELDEICKFIKGCKEIEKTANFREKIELFKKHLPRDLIEDITKKSISWFEKQSSCPSDADMFYSLSKIDPSLPYASIMLGICTLPRFNEKKTLYKKANDPVNQARQDLLKAIQDSIEGTNLFVTPANRDEIKDKVNKIIDDTVAKKKNELNQQGGTPEILAAIDIAAEQAKNTIAKQLDYFAPVRIKFDRSLSYYFAHQKSLAFALGSGDYNKTNAVWTKLLIEPDTSAAGFNINSSYFIALDRTLALSRIAFAAAIERPTSIIENKIKDVNDANRILNDPNAPSDIRAAALEAKEFNDKYLKLVDNYLLQGIKDEDKKIGLRKLIMAFLWRDPTSLFVASSKSYYTLVSANAAPDEDTKRSILLRFMASFGGIQPGKKLSPYYSSYLVIKGIVTAPYDNPTLVSTNLYYDNSINATLHSIDKSKFDEIMPNILGSSPPVAGRRLRVTFDPTQSQTLTVTFDDPLAAEIQRGKVESRLTEYQKNIEDASKPLVESTRQEFAKRKESPTFYGILDTLKDYWHWGFYGAGGLLGLLGLLDLVSRRRKTPGFMKLLLALGVASIPFIYSYFFEGKGGITDMVMGKEKPETSVMPAPGQMVKHDTEGGFDIDKDLFKDYQPSTREPQLA